MGIAEPALLIPTRRRRLATLNSLEIEDTSAGATQSQVNSTWKFTVDAFPEDPDFVKVRKLARGTHMDDIF